jgi:hypothetical protein
MIIEKLAKIEADKEEWDFESHEGNGYSDFVNGFTKGYKAAQAKIEADLRIAFECGVESKSHCGKITVYKDVNDYIQSLNLYIYFILHTRIYNDFGGGFSNKPSLVIRQESPSPCLISDCYHYLEVIACGVRKFEVISEETKQIKN